MAKKAKRKKSKTSSGKPLSARVAKREMVKKRKK